MRISPNKGTPFGLRKLQAAGTSGATLAAFIPPEAAGRLITNSQELDTLIEGKPSITIIKDKNGNRSVGAMFESSIAFAAQQDGASYTMPQHDYASVSDLRAAMNRDPAHRQVYEGLIQAIHNVYDTKYVASENVGSDPNRAALKTKATGASNSSGGSSSTTGPSNQSNPLAVFMNTLRAGLSI